jgi:hypothetical protein
VNVRDLNSERKMSAKILVQNPMRIATAAITFGEKFCMSERRMRMVIRVSIPKSEIGNIDQMPPLSWISGGRNKALVKCPNGHLFHLDGDKRHYITQDGTVRPSIGCPNAYKPPNDCDFHVWGILEDWNGEE